MLESMISSTPPTPEIEPDYPYIGNTVVRLVLNSTVYALSYTVTGGSLTIHYGSQNAVSSGTMTGGGVITPPSTTREIFLKKTTDNTKFTELWIGSSFLTEISWIPSLETKMLRFQSCRDLIKVSKYLPIGVENMAAIFNGCSKFNYDISSWDTSDVTNMSSGFQNATVFNQDLSGWDVSKVTNRTNFDTGATAWQAVNKPKFLV